MLPVTHSIVSSIGRTSAYLEDVASDSLYCVVYREDVYPLAILDIRARLDRDYITEPNPQVVSDLRCILILFIKVLILIFFTIKII